MLEKIGTTRDEAIGKKCSITCKFENCSTEYCSLKLLKKGINKTDLDIGDKRYTLFASFLTDSDGKNIGHIEVIE